MECNKDEAMRAKDIAVRKFTEGDFSGAKKFALKAQSLYNGLEGITQMISTLEVYISSENKINGESDMYGILGVSPLADEETIKKQYRKLLLQLHPDKNKFIGADGAFQRVTEAFNLLSDKTKRAAYNNRRNIRTAHPKVSSQFSAPTWPTGSGQFPPKFPTHAGVSGAQFGAGRTANQKGPTQGGFRAQVNGFHDPHSSTSSHGKSTKSKSQKASPSIQSFFKKQDTFWTKCNRCMMQYEYMRVYLNQILKCPHCQEGFQAIEVPPPSNLAPARPQHHQKLPSSSGNQKSGHSSSSAARWSPLSGTTTHNGVGYNDKFLNRDKARREYEAALANAKRERNDDPGFVLSGEGPAKRMREMDDRVKNYGQYFGSKVHNMGRELSAMELRKMLSDKALVEIHRKLKDWKLAKEAKSAIKEAKSAAKEAKSAAKEKQKANQKASQKPKLANDVVTSPPVADAQEVASEMMTMNVPDPDFHVFDSDRSESCFADNQVWASYDNDDGMPRFYAIIHEVISINPFKVRLSWLNPKNSAEFGPLDWEDQGLIKSCGEFMVGKHETSNSLNSFSHKVKWVKGTRGSIQVYPGKGQFWALYRNWSPDWNKDTPEDIIHEYDMVEVLDDYTEEQGVRVAPLIKATGFLSVYHKHPELKDVKRIPREEMLRFSHQVPSYVLTGEEGPNAPKGHVELDPAATPTELLHKAAPPSTKAQ